ncbi:hypothetical protein [Streptomyces neyagawaensis]|uniref:hypothetical protein n=1 Tax=Streptomyces neyagawaensis TaxID=42238 RepID=UPI0006E42616|nr:hypothetical protein [Streptomyces neyagawaensis]
MEAVAWVEVVGEGRQGKFGTRLPRSAFRRTLTDHVRNYSASGTLAQPLRPFRGDRNTHRAQRGSKRPEQVFTHAFRTVIA